MQELKRKVRPKQNANGKFVLTLTIYYDAPVPGKPWVTKSKTRLWPPAKKDNGRGIEFDTRADADNFYITHQAASE